MVERGYVLTEIAARRGAPSLETLEGWLAEDSDFRSCFDSARDARRERLADSVIALAADRESSPRDRRLSIDARKWRVALMDKDAAVPDADGMTDENEDLIQRLEEAAKRVELMEREKADKART
jgi:hypothetical protein